MKTEWKYLPKYAQNEWLNRRKRLMTLRDATRQKTPRTKRKNELAESFREVPKKIIRQSMGKKRKNFTDNIDVESMTAEPMETEDLEGAVGGRGMNAIDFNFIPYDVKNHIVYEYFDDPNKLCDRLRLLVSSRNAGNTNHLQEINSIMDELRELKCIT